MLFGRFLIIEGGWLLCSCNIAVIYIFIWDAVAQSVKCATLSEEVPG